MASSNAGKLSREEFRRQKDLDAARKAGTAPAEVDELGRPINPHIPQYISKAPWYLDTGAPSLAHQRRPEYDDSASKLNEWYDRGAKAGPAATKYRKGACENCGAMTHKKKDCLERPRKKGAKFTNQDIAADEVIQDIQAGYDAKRDRWNGYDPAEHSKIYEEYAAVEAARTKLREEQIDSQTDAAVRKVAKASGGGNDEFGSSDEEDEDEDKYADAADAVGQKLDAKTRITVRNLRIREDTAKYLINLDPTSAYYDPKTRSMRDNPNKNVRPEDAQFAGDNFLRNSGDSVDVQRLQLFAWQSEARGNDVHLHANPTQGEILHQQYKEKKEQLKSTSKVGILAKYGGEEYLEKAPKELLNGQTEDYVEYSRTGQVIKGRERAKARSKYDEDVFTNNHTAVWGSWYQASTGKWGFACCHSTLHGSYCAGQAGIEAAESASAQKLLNPPKSLLESHAESSGKGKEKAQSNEDPSLSKKRLGDVDVSLDKEKLQRALAEERKRKKGELDDDGSDKKRKYNSAAGGNMDVTEEELEAYRMQRSNYEDPMANYKDTAYNRIDDAGHEPEFPTQPDCCFVSTRADHSTPRAALMSSMFRKKAASKKSVDAFSDSEQSESDVSNAPTTAGRADPTKPAPGPGSSPSTKSMSSEAWTVIIGLLLGIVGRLLYAQFGGIEHYVGSLDAKDDSLWASVLRDLNAQEGTIGAVVIGLWEGVLLHQIMRISARAAAGVFAGLAGRLLIDLVSPEPGQAIRFTASLLGISLGMLFSEVIRGVFDEKDHWEDRKVTHYHKSSRRLRKSSGRRRRTTSTAELDDPDLTDDPRSVAATSIAGTAFTAGTSFTTRSEREKRSVRHRRALSERDSQHAESVIRGASPLPHVLTGDLEAEIADLRRQASAAAGQQRKYQEASARREQKYEYAQGNGARALQLAWEVKRYEALAESLTRQVGDKIVEAHRRAVEKELATPLPAGRSVTPAQRSTGAVNRPGGYHSENDSRRKQAPVRVTVSAGGETYEVTADDEEVEIGPNLRVRTRHVYQPPISQPPEPAPDPVLVTPTRSTHTRQSSVTPTPSPARPPRSVPRSKLSNFAQSVGGDDDDMRSVSVGSRAKTRSRRDSD